MVPFTGQQMVVTVIAALPARLRAIGLHHLLFTQPMKLFYMADGPVYGNQSIAVQVGQIFRVV